jgi:hypothetical protein
VEAANEDQMLAPHDGRPDAIRNSCALRFAQDFQVVSNFPPTTLADALRAKGISDFSEPSLIATLTNSDPQVRIIAAMKLAEDHDDDSAPAVESALYREQNLSAQIGLSQALWSLHDEKGLAHLHAMCTNPSLGLMILISVVDALSLSRSPAGVCAETFFAAMVQSKEAGEVAMGAGRLARIYPDANPEQARRIVTALQSLLADSKQEPTVRMAASGGLSEIGTPECAQAIRGAIAHEQNPDVRTFFEATLKGLKMK